MASLRAALAEAKDGRGQIAMLVGEPGIGKSRTAQELAGHARDQGATVLWGWCYEGEGAPPYWPWVEPIRTYVGQTEPGMLRAQLGAGLADIAGLVPEVAEKLGDVPAPTPVEPEQARFRLFDAVTSFLKRAAADQPMLLVLDDLQWADEPSLLLLQFLARQIEDSRLMVVLTSREVEAAGNPAVSETLAQLSRLPAFRRHVLGGLEVKDVHRLFQAEAGHEADAGLVQSLHAHTGGNPFFLSEVIRLLAAQGATGEERGDTVGGELGLPQGVREVIGQRLRRLTEECNRALATASVVGREFDFRMLGIVMEDIPESGLLELVEEALAAHIVEEAAGQGERYQFTHALVQQTLLESLSASRKVRLHARIGEVLETMYGDDPGNRVAELAYHFSQAAPVLGPGKSVQYSILAGERALKYYAHEEAMDHFLRGLGAKGIDLDQSDPLPDGEAAELLFGLGKAQAAVIRGGAVRNLTRAFDFYAEAGDSAKAVEVARYPIIPGVGRIRVTGLISRALQLAPEDSLEAAHLLSRYGWAVGQELGDYEQAMSALNKALSIAQAQDDRELQMETLANASEVNFFCLRLNEVLENNAKILELGDGVTGLQAEAISSVNAALAGFVLGGQNRPQELLAACVAAAERISHRPLLAAALFINAAAEFVQGDMDAARKFTKRGLSSRSGIIQLLLTGAIVEYSTGNFEAGAEYVERLKATARNIRPGPSLEFATNGYGLPILAEISGSFSDLDEARAASEAVLSSSAATPFAAFLARVGLALNSLLAGDVAGADRQYQGLKQYQGQFMAWIGVDEMLGRICQAAGRHEQAVAHFESGLDFCHRNAYITQVPRICLPYAETLRVRNQSGDLERAQRLIEEGLAAARGVGMVPFETRLLETQDRLASEGLPAPAYPQGLTQREVEVLRLVAAGRTDREIAEELIISVRTVTTHVGNILNKTGAANRAEAASFATRHGLD